MTFPIASKFDCRKFRKTSYLHLFQPPSILFRGRLTETHVSIRLKHVGFLMMPITNTQKSLDIYQWALNAKE